MEVSNINILNMDIEKKVSMDERQLTQLIDVIPTSAMVVDFSGNILHANQELSELLGYDTETLTHSNIEQLLPKEYRGHHKSLMQQFIQMPSKRLMGAGKELYALNNKGKKIPIEIGLNPIKVAHETLVLATIIDISSRIQANKLFENSVSHAPYGVMLVSADGIIKYVNTALCDCFSYPAKDLLGATLETLLPERYRSNHHLLRHSFVENPSIRMMGAGRDLTALDSQGKEFPVEIGISPFLVDNSEMVLVSLVDITQRKRMENELKEKNTNLEEFTYVASHDLRSPLRGISDLLVWIKEDLGTDCKTSISKNIQRISERVEKMEKLIETLLAYARAGNFHSNVKRVNITRLLDNILSLIEIPGEFEVTLDIAVGSINSAVVPLETILRNIISNAFKHHDKQQGKIHVSCHKDNSMLHFMVSDDGPGIPERSKERIFRLFQTASEVENGNTGIGLSVCRRLAETHGGRISVDNNSKHQGATFHLWWPRFIRKDNHD